VVWCKRGQEDNGQEGPRKKAPAKKAPAKKARPKAPAKKVATKGFRPRSRQGREGARQEGGRQGAREEGRQSGEEVVAKAPVRKAATKAPAKKAATKAPARRLRPRRPWPSGAASKAVSKPTRNTLRWQCGHRGYSCVRSARWRPARRDVVRAVNRPFDSDSTMCCLCSYGICRGVLRRDRTTKQSALESPCPASRSPACLPAWQSPASGVGRA